MAWEGLRFRKREIPLVQPAKLGEFFTIDQKLGKTQIVSVPANNRGKIAERWECSDVKHPGPPYVNGGHLFIQHLKVPVEVRRAGRCTAPNTDQSGTFNQDRTRCYSGEFQLGALEHGFNSHGVLETFGGPDSYNALNPDDLTSLGNRAYNKLRPKVEVASVAQSLFEMREIPRMLKTTSEGLHDSWKALGGSTTAARMAPQKVANQFLNAQFGWVPFVREVNGVCDVAVNFDVYHDKIRDHNDKWTNRMFSEDTVESDELVYSGSTPQNESYPSLPTFMLVGPSVTTVRLKKYERVWYKGQFKYYRPEYDYSKPQMKHLRTVRQYLTQLGLNASPTTIYKVMPWTWLIDWFANGGDFVQRLQDMATNAVVSKYFYIMRHSFYTYEYRNVFTTKDGTTHDLIWERLIETKRRGESSSPFNFTSQPGGLSGMQLAILAALGLSHS